MKDALKEAIARLERVEAELRETRAALRHRDAQLAFMAAHARSKKQPRKEPKKS